MIAAVRALLRGLRLADLAAGLSVENAMLRQRIARAERENADLSDIVDGLRMLIDDLLGEGCCDAEHD